MAIVLATKPGLTGANTLDIPTDWDQKWFRNLINNKLKGGDVRNAVGANGIVVTGNIASPYAKISLGGGPISVSGPVVIGPPASGTALTLNAAASALAEVINASSGQYGLVINGASFAGLSLVASGQTFGTGDFFMFQNSPTADGFLGLRGANSFHLQTNSTDRVTVDSTGHVAISSSGGTTLNIGVADNTNGIVINDVGPITNGFNILIEHTGSIVGFIGTGPATFSGAATADFGIACNTGVLRLGTGSGSTTRMSIANDGGVLVGNPTGGSKGAGTINIQNGVYLNGVLFTNP